MEQVNPNLEQKDISIRIQALCDMLEEPRKARMLSVLNARTRRLCLVLEDVFQPHNAAAVLRSCDAFGVQDVHLVANRNDVTLQPLETGVSMGSEKWLTLRKWGEKYLDWREEESAPYRSTLECARALKKRGYALVAATLRPDSVPPEEIPLDRPIALWIGSEGRGLSQTAHAQADLAVKLPMLGFVQSLNLSVCAALLLRAISEGLRRRGGWELPQAEKDALLLSWLRRQFKEAPAIEERALLRARSLG